MKHTVKEINYIKVVIGWHIGFLLFILLYTAIGILMEELMGTATFQKEFYSMSGLLIVMIDVFGAYFVGFFEGLCFVFFIQQKWKGIILNCLTCFVSLLIIYVLLLQVYCFLCYVSERGSYILIGRGLQKAIQLAGKESIGIILAGFAGKAICRRKSCTR